MKTILIKGIMKGCGVVNFDDNSQKFALNKLGIKDIIGDDNVKYAKKVFFKTDNGYDYRVKISGDCIRKGIFSNSVENVNPMVVKNEIVACNYFLSPVGICRGYLYTNRDESGYKRKSPLTITDAIENGNAKSELEIGTTSGDRNSTSMFYTEKIGEAEYNFKGIIDLKQLMFIVADPLFDRMAINPDWLTTGVAEKVMKNLYGDKSSPRIGYFTASSKYLTNSIAEFGMLLNEELVAHLAKYILANIMKCSIKRNNAYASVKSLKIKFVENIINDKMDDEEGWITINDLNDIANLEIHADCPYKEATEKDIELLNSLKNDYNDAISTMKEEKKKQKEEKARKRKEKKESES